MSEVVGRHHRGGRLAVVALGAALVVVACTGDDPDAGPTGTPPTPPATVAADTDPGPTEVSALTTVPYSVEIDPADPRPILTVASWSLWIRTPSMPEDLPLLAIYPDGTVVRVSAIWDERSSTQAVLFESTSLAPDDLTALVEAGADAGLIGGGVQRRLPYPVEGAIQDGAATVFSLRDGDRWTTRALDHAVDEERPVGERALFVPLIERLPWEYEVDQLTVVQPTRWAVVEYPYEADPMAPQAWTGPVLDEQTWTEIAPGVRCTVVEQAEWDFGREEAGSGPVVAGYGFLSRRPLLPHEDDCDDVGEWLRVLGLVPVDAG